MTGLWWWGDDDVVWRGVSFYRVLDVIGFFRAECWRFGDLRAKFGNEKGYQLTQFT